MKRILQFSILLVLLSLPLLSLAACIAPIPPQFFEGREEEPQTEPPTFAPPQQEEPQRQPLILNSGQEDAPYYDKLNDFAEATREFRPFEPADEAQTRRLFQRVAREFSGLLETGGSTQRDAWHFGEVLWPENGFYVMRMQEDVTLDDTTYRLFTLGNSFEQRVAGAQHSLHLQYWQDAQEQVGSLVLGEGQLADGQKTLVSGEIIAEQALVLVKQVQSGATLDQGLTYAMAGAQQLPFASELSYTFATFRLDAAGIENYYPLAEGARLETAYWRLTPVELEVQVPQPTTYLALGLEINWQRLLDDNLYYYLDAGQTHILFDIYEQPEYRLYLELVDGLYTPQTYEGELW